MSMSSEIGIAHMFNSKFVHNYRQNNCSKKTIIDPILISSEDVQDTSVYKCEFFQI